MKFSRSRGFRKAYLRFFSVFYTKESSGSNPIRLYIVGRQQKDLLHDPRFICISFIYFPLLSTYAVAFWVLSSDVSQILWIVIRLHSDKLGHSLTLKETVSSIVLSCFSIYPLNPASEGFFLDFLKPIRGSVLLPITNESCTQKVA